MLCLRLKSSLCSCPHCILDVTSFSSADSVRRASNNGVGQFKPIFQVEGNTFHPIFFSYFIADWLLYNFAAGSVYTTKLCSRLYLIEIAFYPPKNWKISYWATLRGSVCTPSIARWKALLDFLFAIIELSRSVLRLRCYKRESVEVGGFRRRWVTSRLNFKLKGYFRANIYGPLDRGMAVLQLCHWKFSHKEVCSRLFDWSWLLLKRQKIALWAT